MTKKQSSVLTHKGADFAKWLQAEAAKIGKELDTPPVSMNRGGYVTEAISSGSLVYDVITGGGTASGRIVDIFGPEASGKSTIAYQSMADAMSKDIPTFFYDHEGGTDPLYIANLGIDFKPGNYLWSHHQSTTGEQSFRHISRTLDLLPDSDVRGSGFPKIFFCIDSVAAMLPEDLAENDEGNDMSVVAKLQSWGWRLIRSKITRKGASLMFINQLRQKPGVSYGNPEYEPGGESVKFYPDVKVRVSAVGKVENNKGLQTRNLTLRTTKNKQFIPYQIAKELTRIVHGEGIDRTFDTFGYLKLTGQISGSGHYTLNTGSAFDCKLQKNAMLEHISNPEFYDFCKSQLRDSSAFERYMAAQNLNGGSIPSMDSDSDSPDTSRSVDDGDDDGEYKQGSMKEMV